MLFGSPNIPKVSWWISESYGCCLLSENWILDLIADDQDCLIYLSKKITWEYSFSLITVETAILRKSREIQGISHGDVFPKK